MGRLCFAWVLAAGLLHTSLFAQDKIEKKGFDDVKPKVEPKKSPPSGGTLTPVVQPTPGEVEISFLNGSKIRVLIQTPSLEIVSIYGKLAVPIEDVQSIEFGLHYPEGTVEKVEKSLKGLSSGDYRTRETAGRTLVELGPYAYPAVLRATKGKEIEVAARAKEIIEKIQAKHSKTDLKTSTDDRIVTPTQTLVGRITTLTMKTKGEYFGEMDHKIANMRALRAFTVSGGEMTLAVDAGKYANGGQWLDTGYTCDGRSTILITAKGLIDQWPQQPNQYMCGPGGNMGANGGFFPGNVQVNPGAKIRLGGNANRLYGGMLIGKIGENGEPFLIGDRYELKSESEGKLYLQIGASPWNCASAGNYDVKISRKGD